MSTWTGSDRTFSEATEPEKEKAHERKFVGFWLFVVGRAGFEPATNGLKVRDL